MKKAIESHSSIGFLFPDIVTETVLAMEYPIYPARRRIEAKNKTDILAGPTLLFKNSTALWRKGCAKDSE